MLEALARQALQVWEALHELEPAAADGTGRRLRLLFRTRLPYMLGFDIRVTSVQPPSELEAEATGELEGTGRWTLTSADGGTLVRYTWDIRTTRRWMNLLAPVARPVFSWNHDELMRAGGQGLARRLGADVRLRMDLSRRVVALLCLVAMSACSPNSAANPIRAPLTALGNIQLPKEAGKPAFDLLTLDSRNGRLYVPHSSIAALEVVDVRAQKLVGQVTGVAEIKAVALTKDPNVVYGSDATGNVPIIDFAGLKVVKTLAIGGSPDAIAYDPVHDLVVVATAAPNKAAFIDASGQSLVGTIPLPGAPELMTVDPKTGNVYLAIHDLNAVVVIDTAARSIVTTFKGCDIKAPTGVAYDTDRGLLFVAISGGLSIIDVVLEECRGVADIGHGTDQIAVNSHTHHVYTADAGSQQVSVVDTISLKPLGVNGTGPEAATLAVDPTTDMLYVMVTRAGIVGVYHDP